MQQNIYDTTSSSNKVDYLNIFPAMTCTSEWPEFKNALSSEQTVIDRPNIVAQGSRTKPRALMASVIEEQSFG